MIILEKKLVLLGYNFNSREKEIKLRWSSYLSAAEIQQERVWCSGRYTGSQRSGMAKVPRSKFVTVPAIEIKGKIIALKKQKIGGKRENRTVFKTLEEVLKRIEK